MDNIRILMASSNEIELSPILLVDFTTLIDLLNYLFSNNSIAVFSNLSTTLRIYLKLSVTVVHGERYFSKLIIIFLSTLSQTRLTNLSLFSIKHDIPFEISKIIQEFVTVNAR